MSTDDYARGFKDHCAHGQQGRCATCVEAFARVRAAALEAAAKHLDDTKDDPRGWDSRHGDGPAAELRTMARRALAASTVTVDTGTGPYEAQTGTEPMPIPRPDALREFGLKVAKRARGITETSVCYGCAHGLPLLPEGSGYKTRGETRPEHFNGSFQAPCVEAEFKAIVEDVLRGTGKAKP